MPLRVAFMGTPDFAVPSLRGLVDRRYDVVCVYTQPPRPAGRGHQLRPSAVHQLAEALGIETRTPKTLRDGAEQNAFRSLALDACVVAAYGLILPNPILDAPRLGCLNVHASLLPRWRGAAPIQRAILAGDTETGVTIMQMDEGLDTGAILLQGKVAITQETTAQTLHDALADVGAGLIVEALDGVTAGRIRPVPQPEQGVTYAAKLTREEGRLDWREPAAFLQRKTRALAPWPGAWYAYRSARIKVLAAEVAAGTGEPGTVLDDSLSIACGEGALRPLLLQREGRQPMAPADFLRGFAIPAGTRLP